MIFTALILLVSPVMGLANGGFSETCSSYWVSGTTLHADCLAIDQHIDSTSINLDICLVNSNGELGCWRGDYGASCWDCGLSGTIFGCTCNNDEHNPVYTSVNLDNCITNDNGALTC
ncbi:Cyanovirin-N [Phlebopus sp. FC_14]|nr:Cyanovirin-N [Phlebopus sp. FC_14]